MDELIEELDAQMAAEERTFLSPLILRADEIRQCMVGGEPDSGPSRV